MRDSQFPHSLTFDTDSDMHVPCRVRITYVIDSSYSLFIVTTLFILCVLFILSACFFCFVSKLLFLIWNMRPFIVIRQFESVDMMSRKELIKQYAMSFAFDAFTSCLFREVFIYTAQVLLLIQMMIPLFEFFLNIDLNINSCSVWCFRYLYRWLC